MNGGPDDEDAADGHSATAKAAEWASRIMTISLEMVLPGVAGYWLDTKLGTQVVFLLVGFALGGYLAFLQLKAIAQSTTKSTKNRVGK
jgi:F0F1-type ATP synthase assembly protein I